MARRGIGRAAGWRLGVPGSSFLAATFLAIAGVASLAAIGGLLELSAPAAAKQAKVPLPKAAKRADPTAADPSGDPTGEPLPANDDGTIGSGDDAMDAPAGAPQGRKGVDPSQTDETGGVVADPSGGVETLDGDVDNPDGGAPGQRGKAAPSGEGIAAPRKGLLAPPAPGPVADGPPVNFTLEARLTDASPPLLKGVSWRIFDAAPTNDGKLKLVGEAHGGSVRLMLKPGGYFVHASYGRASAMHTITVGHDIDSDNVVLNAGGLRLSAMVGKDQPLNGNDVSFDIYAPSDDGSEERALVVSNAPSGHIIGLNAGTYHVICRYGESNAIVRADIKVQPGKLTEAAIFQKAARLTLKLVSEAGGEAIANTAWSVVTPSGESVADFVGAFPSVVLAAGEYTAIAKHEGKMYERNFTVEPGLNHDIEVIAK